MSGQNADERGPDGGNRMEDSLRIAIPVVQVAHEQLAVEPCRQVAVRIHEWNIMSGHAIPRDRHKSENRPVPDNARGECNELPAAARPQFHSGGGQIAKRNPLRHAFKAKTVNIETDDWGRIHQKTDGNKNQAPPKSVGENARARLAALQTRGDGKYQ